MKKIGEHIGELQKIYDIFTLEESNRIFIDTEFEKINTSKAIWLKEYIECVLGELEEAKHMLGKILNTFQTKNKILVSDIEYFSSRVNNGIVDSYRKIIKDNYEENFDSNSTLFKPIRQELIGSIGNYSETLTKLNEIVELWSVDKDKDYYYFLPNKEENSVNTKNKDSYYKDKGILIGEKHSEEENQKITIFKNSQLISSNGKETITVKGKEKLLCNLIFSDGYLRDGNFNFLTIEEEVYDEEKQQKDAIKGLIKRVKAKLIKLGYPEKIFEAPDETLIIKKNL